MNWKMQEFWLVLTYDLLEDNRIAEVTFKKKEPLIWFFFFI